MHARQVVGHFEFSGDDPTGARRWLEKGRLKCDLAKVKFDRQIVAIAKVTGASAIYSDDGDIEKLAARSKIQVIKLKDIPLPPAKAQLDLELASQPEGADVRKDDATARDA